MEDRIERSYDEIIEEDIYETVQGDTWDIISYKVYGSEKHIDKLLLANSELASIFIFNSNVEIICPDIDIEQSGVLPPWKSD